MEKSINPRKDYDIGRTAEMEKYGLKVIRFNNSEVENSIDDVVRRIEDEVKSRISITPITPPTPKGVNAENRLWKFEE
jgi:hypothetical protein